MLKTLSTDDLLGTAEFGWLITHLGHNPTCLVSTLTSTIHVNYTTERHTILLIYQACQQTQHRSIKRVCCPVVAYNYVSLFCRLTIIYLKFVADKLNQLCELCESLHSMIEVLYVTNYPKQFVISLPTNLTWIK